MPAVAMSETAASDRCTQASLCVVDPAIAMSEKAAKRQMHPGLCVVDQSQP